MAWSWTKQDGGKGDPWTIEQPQSKKRKLGLNKNDRGHADAVPEVKSTGQDEWGDDSMDLTQAQIEEMDLLMSQATQSETTKVPEVSEPERDSVWEDPGSAFIKPSKPFGRLASTSSSTASHKPAALRSRSNDNSISTSSHFPTKSVPQSQLAQQEQQMKKAQEDKYRAEGETMILRETLKKMELEIERLRAERDEFTDEQKRVQTEREHQLKLQLDSFKSQAHFKQRELESQNEMLSQKLKTVQQTETQPNASASPKPPSPRKVMVRPSPPSRTRLQLQQSKKAEESHSSSQQSDFPTRMSFMEQISPAAMGGSPTVKTLKVSNTASQTEQTSKETDVKSDTSVTISSRTVSHRRLKLNFPLERGGQYEPSGSQVVSHLLQTGGPSTSSSHTEWDPGLTGLLHNVTTPLSLASLSYRRGHEAANLSPVKPKRLMSGSGLHTVVSQTHFKLAIEGLTKLLGSKRQLKDLLTTHNPSDQDRGSKESSPDDVSPKDKNANNTLVDGSDDKSVAASLLLPLLTDYLHHYLDLVQSGVNVGISTHRSQPPDIFHSQLGSSTSTASSSLDSLSSMVLELLQDGRVYGSSVEQLALSALRTLLVLIQLCPALCDRVLASTNTTDHSVDNGSSTLNGSGGLHRSKVAKKTSGTEADDEHSTSSSSDPRPSVGECGSGQRHKGRSITADMAELFQVLVRLAGQDLEDMSANPLIVQQTLKVLTALCEHCSLRLVERLSPVLTQGVLFGCFKQGRSVPVIVCAQRLLQAMARSESLLAKVCTRTENCPLFLMYSTCSRTFDKDQQNLLKNLYKGHIWSMSGILSHQPNNLSCLLSSSCNCCNELAASVVLALDGLSSLQCTPSELLSGVTTVLQLVQGDQQFGQHRARVKPQYVRVLADLASNLRAKQRDWNLELMVVEDLCDFESDSGNSSQDAEPDDAMEIG